MSLPRQSRVRIFAASLLTTSYFAAHVAPNAVAYEAITHVGITSNAALQSQLHRILRDFGLQRGLFEPIALSPTHIDRVELHQLKKAFSRMDPSGGYRPSDQLRQSAISWLLAGSALAKTSSELWRNAFYDPSHKRGLTSDRKVLAFVASVANTLEGDDTTRDLLTATGFDLTGQAATTWIDAADNPFSVQRVRQQLSKATNSTAQVEKQHHLAMALISAGVLLATLQDMASPTHVRNDFAIGHMQKLSHSTFNRGNPYERFVAEAYNRFTLPGSTAEAISQPEIRDYFSSTKWTGLADQTAKNYFSPGTVPLPVTLTSQTNKNQLLKRINGSLIYSLPQLLDIDLTCPLDHTCYITTHQGMPALAYRIHSRTMTLKMFLDATCYNAAAQQLVPQATSYSAGLLNHLFNN